MSIITRRGFIGGILAAAVAPAIVKADILMPVKKIISPRSSGWHAVPGGAILTSEAVDFSEFFQDAEGTIPAVVGGPVGLYIGHRGLRMVQTAAARRPTLVMAADGRPGLNFEAPGVDWLAAMVPAGRP